ncbi:polycomb group RING finger protein 3-like [Grus japonensis]|uniref:Polycomb group RING finger protein 3-like n=1 Tax=Grus japonensis TaxID=30415 RepID=A0ABC9Y353_GRUJA
MGRRIRRKSHDRTMQDIVYKLVPGLQEAEMKKQREFYHKLGMEVPGDIRGETCSAKQHLDSHRNGETKPDENSNKETSEEKQEEDNDYHRSDEQVSICLECNSSKLRGLKRKWIRCSAQATVLHLKKFIAKKLNLSSFNELECMELHLGMDEEPTESLWLRIKGRAGAGDIIVGVCYRPPDQGDRADEALYRQIGAASRSQALVLMGDFNHPDICWRDNAAERKQSRRFLECVDDNFLLQVTEEPTRRGAMLDLVLTNKEGLVGDVKLKGSLGCRDHEMVEFRILRAARRAHSKLTTLDFRRADLGLFRDLLGRIPWDKALEGRGAQDSWLVFKNHLLQAQERCIPTKRKSSKNTKRPPPMDEQGAPGQSQTKKGSLQRVEARAGSLGGIQRNCLSSQGSG